MQQILKKGAYTLKPYLCRGFIYLDYETRRILHDHIMLGADAAGPAFCPECTLQSAPERGTSAWCAIAEKQRTGQKLCKQKKINAGKLRKRIPVTKAQL